MSYKDPNKAKEYFKAWYQAHKEERKEQRKACAKAYYQAHKEERKEYAIAYRQAHKEEMKEYYQAHKEEKKASAKAWYEAHKEEMKAKVKAWKEANKEQCNAYMRAYYQGDVNVNGETKQSIRQKSRIYLSKYGTKIPGYQIHHCCTYTEPYKFIYCSKEMHRLIHAYLRQHNIDADSNHYEQIKHLLDDTVVKYGIE